MTMRQPNAPGRASAAAPNLGAAPPGSVYANGRNGAEARASRALGWQDWLGAASPAQRAHVLELAASQGFVYGNQIPQPAPNSNNRPLQDDSIPAPALSRLFSGPIGDLPPVVAQPVPCTDESLDAAQREAVARALATPDVFLLQGLPGTGRSRVLAEILRQAALRGDRVLFLANHAAPLDVVLSRLQHDPTIFALRFAAPGEPTENLPTDLAFLSPMHRQRMLIEQANQKAGEALLEAQSQCARRRAEKESWATLTDLAGRIECLRGQIQERRERLERTAAEVGRAAAAGALAEPCRGEIARLESAHAQQLAALCDDGAAIEEQARAPTAERLEVAQAIQALTPLAQAKRAARWWTRAWWRATWRGNVVAKMVDLEQRRQMLEATLQALDRCRQDIEEKRKRAEEGFVAEKLKLVESEIDRRRQEYSRQILAGKEELAPLEEEWRPRVGTLENHDHRPPEPTRAAVAVAKTSWEHQLTVDAETCQFAQRWAEYCTGDGAQLGSRVTEWANVLAGTTAALSHDTAFAEAARTPFDLLVVEEADPFTEREILHFARLAARWVLVARMPSLPAEPAPRLSVACRDSATESATVLSGFQKLWRQLHGTSNRLGYAWSKENDRLCATLRPLSMHDRHHLESERLADFPEIELRILSMPKATPVVAQVVFPRAMPIAEAKQFIYRELEEVAIEGWPFGAWLAEDADCFTLHWDPAPASELDCLELELGVREWLAPASARTCRLEFRRAAGWTRPRVDQWLARYLCVRDVGRTMALRREATGSAE